jgi:FtsH-binding integral membrane protein
MSQANMYYGGPATFAAHAPADARASFIMQTYLHLVGAIGVFVAIEAALLQLTSAERIVGTMLSGYNWLIVLGAFMVVSWLAHKWATSAVSLPMQYAGLALYVVAEAVIFLPLLYVASNYGGENVIPAAGLVTGLLFGGLTLIVFVTRKDFSFLRGILLFGGLAALALIVAGMIFNFEMGTFFVVAMIALACGHVLYDTSNVLHHYRIGQHVAAALSLFASVALLFWYVLRLLMALNSRR